jgi:hypothetical protein
MLLRNEMLLGNGGRSSRATPRGLFGSIDLMAAPPDMDMEPNQRSSRIAKPRFAAL